MKNRKGFTLLELIVSIALIGILTVSLLTVFNTGLLNIVRAGVRTEAVNIAEEELIDNPIIIEEKSIIIVLPTPKGDVTYNIEGSGVKGKILLNGGFASSVEVEIQAFVPGLFKDIE